MRLGGVTLVGVRTQVEWVLLHQVIRNCQRAGVIQVRLAGRSIGLERVDDLRLAAIQSLFAGFLHIEINKHLVIDRCAVALNLCIAQSGAVHGRADSIVIRRMREFYIDQRAPSEVYS